MTYNWIRAAADEICDEVYETSGPGTGISSDEMVAIIAKHAEPLVSHLAEIRDEWESCTSREASTFAELKERRAQVAAFSALLRESKREHYHCDDSWYCCALCTNEDHGELDGHDAVLGEAARTKGVCSCSANAWNARIDAALKSFVL